ncbi:MAG: hypothetical protein IPG25_07515 [Proteobacteria bacterium]|nr:hypothetical protein [Pseudomonadota bacterium]
MIRRAACVLLSLALAPANWASAPAAVPQPRVAIVLTAAQDAGWQEALISTQSLAALEQFFTTVAGYQVLWRGMADPSIGAFYGLPRQPYREVLIGADSALPGLIRLVEFAAPNSVTIRANAQPWDTGGILSVMTRSNDTLGVWQAAQALGWSGYNEPVDFDFGPVKLRNVILRGPDGVNVSVYERLAPRMPDADDLRKLRRPFNAMQSVQDLSRTRNFYVDALGFEVINSGAFSNPRRAPNNFGTPANLVVAAPLEFAIFAPRKDSPTAVETVQMRGVEGRSVGAAATPPNRGIVSLRYPVSDLARITTRLRQHGIAPTIAAREIVLNPYGPVRALAVRSPDGAMLEFFEPMDARP